MSRKAYELAWSGAAALKNHCHNVFQTLGSATPPEVFLYRGNAYYALGLPFLALADYESAAKFLSLSNSRHQDRCWAAAKSFPALQKVVYPGTNSHLHICVRPLLDARCDVVSPSQAAASKSTDLSLVGLPLNGEASATRRVTAAAALPPGTSVLQPSSQAPWLQYPLQDQCCSRCCQPLASRRFACHNPECHEEYCSRDCRQLALQEYHSGVCTNKAVQGIELDLYVRMREEENAKRHRELAALLLTLRVMAAAVAAQASPTALPQIRILSAFFTFSTLELCGGMLQDYQRIAVALRVTTSVSYEEFLGVYGRVWSNARWEELEEEPHADADAKAGVVESAILPPAAEAPELLCADYRSIQLHLPYAMFQHSCAPNVCEVVQNGGQPALLTSRPVAAGEELTVTRFPKRWLSLCWEERQRAMSALGHTCSCQRCKDRQ